jgi:hypothetical protein
LRKALATVLCISAMMACQKSRVESLQARLDEFRSVLPSSIRQQFDSREYESVAAAIDSLIQVDPRFNERYQKVKHEELIDVFSSQEVVDFFREHFVEEIERLKEAQGTGG